MIEVEGQIVKWEPRWTTPVLNATCPHCGVEKHRLAGAWSGSINGTFSARVPCEQGFSMTEAPSCCGVFNVMLVIPDE